MYFKNVSMPAAPASWNVFAAKPPRWTTWHADINHTWLWRITLHLFLLWLSTLEIDRITMKKLPIQKESRICLLRAKQWMRIPGTVKSSVAIAPMINTSVPGAINAASFISPSSTVTLDIGATLPGPKAAIDEGAPLVSKEPRVCQGQQQGVSFCGIVVGKAARPSPPSSALLLISSSAKAKETSHTGTPTTTSVSVSVKTSLILSFKPSFQTGMPAKPNRSS